MKEEDVSKTAQRIWGDKEASPEFTAPSAPVSKPVNQQEVAERVWGRESAIRHENGDYSSALRAPIERLSNFSGLDQEGAKALQREMAGVAYDMGLTGYEAGDLANRYEKQVRDGVDRAEVGEWSERAHRKIKDTYGSEADALLEAAKSYVRSRPALAKLLGTTGLGSHPAYVEKIVERVRKLKLQGKL